MATMKEMAEAGVSKIRRPEWNEAAYLELQLFDGGNFGPWATLHDGAPQKILVLQVENDGWEPWQ